MSEKQTTEEILSEVESRLRNAGIIPHDLEMEVGGEYSFYCRLGRDTVLARANAAGFKCSPLIGGDYLIIEREEYEPLPPSEPQAAALDGAVGADPFANEVDSDDSDVLLKEALKRVFDYASTTGKNRDKELAFIKWYIEAQQAQISGMTIRLRDTEAQLTAAQSALAAANSALEDANEGGGAK
jgi:hypothetical protein